MILRDLTNLWLDFYVKPTKAVKTYQCYRDCAKIIERYCPHLYSKSIHAIDELEIQQFIFSLEYIYSKSTLNHLRGVFYQSFHLAKRRGYISTNVISKLELPKNASEKKVRALTNKEQKIIEECAKRDISGHILLFLLLTGLRSSELFNLKWSDYCETDNTISVTKSKTSAGVRTIPLCREAVFIIQYCKSKKSKIHDFIFSNTKGRPTTKSSLKRLFERVSKDSGIKLTPHMCRHSFATRLVENKIEYKALSVLMGHRNISFTLQRYATADIDFLKNQLQLIAQR